MSEHQEPMDIVPIYPSIDMQDPPAEDSPMNILNKLNNYCIQAIFQQIDNVRDYHSAANVCTRFQANAIRCFPAKFEALMIRDSEYLRDRHIFNQIPLSEVKSYLMLFGHLIQSLMWWEQDNQANNNGALNVIAKYCGNTLKNLEIPNSNLDWTLVLPHFTALEKLWLRDTNLTNFELHSPLKELKFFSNNTPVPFNTWFIQSFPQLESIEFLLINNLNDDMIIVFLNLNPQLRCIKMVNCLKLTTTVFNDIGHRVPNLEQFRFETFNSMLLDDNMRHLRNLKKLKNLSITNKLPANELIQLLVENQIPIEILSIGGTSNSWAKAPTLDGLINLTVYYVPDEILPSLVNKHPKLKDLNVIFPSEITMDGVKKTLEFGKNLTTVSFVINNFDIDEQGYKSVLALVKNRIKLRILINVGTVTVPPDTINANFKWIDLSILRPRQ